MEKIVWQGHGQILQLEDHQKLENQEKVHSKLLIMNQGYLHRRMKKRLSKQHG